MEKRAIFPALMFGLGVLSFAFGIWQYTYARAVQASTQKRLAYIVTTIAGSSTDRAMKKRIIAEIMAGLPGAPTLFGIDFSGSFASQGVDDRCSSDGQRAVCRALAAEHTAPDVQTEICGSCNPQ